jgi:hypothetical protein
MGSNHLSERPAIVKQLLKSVIKITQNIVDRLLIKMIEFNLELDANLFVYCGFIAACPYLAFPGRSPLPHWPWR